MRISRYISALAKTAFSVVLVAMMFCLQTKADTIQVVTSRSGLAANDQVNWSQLGPPDTDVLDGSSTMSSGGLAVTVTEPEYGFQIRQQENADHTGPFPVWPGHFQAGDTVLCNCNSPFPVTFSFSSPVYGAGFQIEPASGYSGYGYSVHVSAFSGTTLLAAFSVDAISAGAIANDSAPFVGVLSDSADVTSLTYRIDGQIDNSPYEGDIGVNEMSIRTLSPVPEPSSIALLLGGLPCLILARRRCLGVSESK